VDCIKIDLERVGEERRTREKWRRNWIQLILDHSERKFRKEKRKKRQWKWKHWPTSPLTTDVRRRIEQQEILLNYVT